MTISMWQHSLIFRPYKIDVLFDTISPLLVTTSKTKTFAAKIQVIFLRHFGSHHHRFHHTLKFFAFVGKKTLEIKRNNGYVFYFFFNFLKC